MAKYQKSGVIDHINKHTPQYDFCTSTDLHESLNMIQTANDMFADLPSKARKEFDNDPAKFLDFVQNPDNKGKLYELGLSDYPLPDPTEKIEEIPEISEEKLADEIAG